MRKELCNGRKDTFRLAAICLLTVLLSLAFIIGASSYYEDDSFFEAGAETFGNRDTDTFKDVKLIPGGMPFGIKLYTDGVLVVGLTDVNTGEKRERPAEDAGIRPGDVIDSIDGTEVNTVSEVSKIIEKSEGRPLVLSVIRDNEKTDITLTPKKSVDDGVYKAGLWIRDSTSGVGTVTYIDPETLSFAGLGHGINDVDTTLLIPMSRANVLSVTIIGAQKGKAGEPGELHGTFEPEKLGTLSANTPYGVFGKLDALPENAGEAIDIAQKDEIRTGDCEIISTVGPNTERYTAKIVKKDRGDSMQKNFVIEVTDERLLSSTGGIVRGMSGSPVIQNGKLVGAVTHVMINDPTRGYGIYIGNMLKNSGTERETAA